MPSPPSGGNEGVGRVNDKAGGTATDAAVRRWSPWSVGALAGTAALLATAAVVHIVMLFLNVAPPNPVSVRYRQVIDTYVQPEFGQDWKLFAPNPKQRNEAVGVRVLTRGGDGIPRTSPWINLTARDIAAIRGNPVPSHLHQNMLRRAWDGYALSHDAKERGTGPRSAVTAAYLKRVVLQRIGREWRGETVIGVQIAGRYTLVPPPGWSTEENPDTTTYRILPWWSVTDEDYRGL